MATISDNVVLDYKLQNGVEVRGLASCTVIGYGPPWPWQGTISQARLAGLSYIEGCVYRSSKGGGVPYSAHYRLFLTWVVLSSYFHPTS